MSHLKQVSGIDFAFDDGVAEDCLHGIPQRILDKLSDLDKALLVGGMVAVLDERLSDDEKERCICPEGWEADKYRELGETLKVFFPGVYEDKTLQDLVGSDTCALATYLLMNPEKMRAYAPKNLVTDAQGNVTRDSDGVVND